MLLATSFFVLPLLLLYFFSSSLHVSRPQLNTAPPVSSPRLRSHISNLPWAASFAYATQQKKAPPKRNSHIFLQSHLSCMAQQTTDSILPVILLSTGDSGHNGLSVQSGKLLYGTGIRPAFPSHAYMRLFHSYVIVLAVNQHSGLRFPYRMHVHSRHRTSLSSPLRSFATYYFIV